MAETVVDAGVPAILIAGAGPVGLVVALELAHHGVASILIDRAAEPTAFPKMDVTNGRSMELLRRLGIADRVRALGVGSHHAADVLWALPDGAPPVGRWELPSVDAQRADFAGRNDGTAPLEADQRAPQSAFEAMGRDLCRAHPLIDFREGVAFESLAQDADGVDVTVSQDGVQSVLRVAYLVGADGAGSRVRRALGIGLEEMGAMPKTFMAHFRSKDRKELHKYGPFWHYFVMGSALIAQDEEDIWTFHAPLFDGVPADGEPDPATLIAERIGLAPVIDEVFLTSIWQPRFALAERYSDGRVFLAGDAVHQVFPTGGYGMNTALGDAIDIGWKLAATVNGWGGPWLLASYDAERRPVGRTNRDYSHRHLGVHIGFVERAMAGATAQELGEYIGGQRGENEFDGIEFGYRYTQSPVVVNEAGEAPRWSEWDYVPSTWPGARPPSFLLSDGRALFDLFGKGLTLVDFRGDAGPLVESAVAQGVPMTHLPLSDAKIHAAWERDYVLVRPDQHVGWRSNILPKDADWREILGILCGRNAVEI